MTLSPELLELHRSRWRRARDPLHLTGPTAEDFSLGGLAAFVAEPRVRLLLLPPDPETWRVDFDEAFWTWWLRDRPDPATAKPMSWGDEQQPTAHAAVRCRRAYDDRPWEQYLALHRCGALEFDLGGRGTYALRERQVFRLLPIVGRVWAALTLYGEVVERFQSAGPWELTLALRGTAGALLGHVADGWAEPGNGYSDAPVCAEPHLLLRREIFEWPGADGMRALAFGVGDWVEDAWGVRQRRYIARQGELAGQFDSRRYAM